jgi:GST-like protein
MLEEIGLPYEAHLVDFDRGPAHAGVPVAQPQQQDPGDPRSPTARAAQPLALFESGAILIYLADKTGQLLPDDPALRATTRCSG